MRACAAAMMAPMSAAISRPPTQARMCSGGAAPPAISCLRSAVVDDRGLVGHTLRIEPSARADEILGRHAEQRRGNGRGGGRVADAHLAEDDEIGAILGGALHGPTSGGECQNELFARHGRLLREVARATPRLVGRYARNTGARQRARVDDGERHAQLARQHRHRRTPAGEVVQHLHGDVGRIGRDALHGDSVITGEQHDGRVPRTRVLSRLQGSEANGQRLQHAERARRLGQDVLPRLGRRATFRARLRAGGLDPRCVHAALAPTRSNCGAEWIMAPRRQAASPPWLRRSMRSPGRGMLAPARLPRAWRTGIPASCRSPSPAAASAAFGFRRLRP